VDSLFPSWIEETRQAFLSRNAPGIPIENFSLYGGSASYGKKILVDPRCFTDHFNALASVAQANHMELQHQRHTLNDIRNAFNVESKITSSFIVERLFNIEKSVRRLEDRLIGEAPAPVPPPALNVIRFSISSQCLPNNASLSDVTITFFANNYPTGYAMDTKGPTWNELDPQQKKSLRNKFGSIKRAVRMVLMHADAYPVIANKSAIRVIATAAEKRLLDALGLEDKSISIYKLEKQLKLPEMKEMLVEKSLKLPENTPDDMRKFFKGDKGD